jgi:DNA-binding transcriptional LysR family regulator
METVLSGGAERLLRGEVDLLVAGSVPPGFLGDSLMEVEFMAVSQPQHRLQTLDRLLNLQDLSGQRQIVVRDSATGQRVDAGWLGAEQRWTVSHVATSISMIARGMGFAWLPVTRIRDALADGSLKELPLERGSRRRVSLFLTYADPDKAGPATCRLGELLSQQAITAKQFY